MSTKWCVVPLVLLMTACIRGGTSRDPVARALREADELHAGDGREAALQRYLALAEQYPDDHRVLSRLARALVLEGMASADGARSSWQAARETGLHCLMTGAGFSSQVGASGGRVLPAAVARIPPEHAACAAWTAEAWARQAALRGGAGVALDLPAIQALAAHAVRHPGSGVRAGQAQATLGLSLALTPVAHISPDGGAPRAEAREALERAIELAPDRLLPRVDLAEYVLLPAGEDAAARGLLLDVQRQVQQGARALRPDAVWAGHRSEALLHGP